MGRRGDCLEALALGSVRGPPRCPPGPCHRAGSDSRPGGSALEAPGRRGWNHLMGETGREKPPSFGTSSRASLRNPRGHGGIAEPSSCSPRAESPGGAEGPPAGHPSLGLWASLRGTALSRATISLCT